MVEPLRIPENPNEGILLDLSNQMKDIVEEKDSVIKTISEKYMDSKKLITKIYGQIRIVQEQLDDRGTPAGTDDYLYMKEEKVLGIYGY